MNHIFNAKVLQGQVILISGAGSGMGRKAALQLASLGAQVEICGRRIEPLQQTAAMDPNGRIGLHPCDIREPEQVEAMVDAVLAKHGRIDTLVNNAGGQFLSPAEKISINGFRTVLKLNLEGSWIMTHTVAVKAMIPARQGKMMSITMSPHNGHPGAAHSFAARAGIENLMRTLSVEWARFNIKLNAIAIGMVETEVLHTKYPKGFYEAIAGSVPLGRLGSEQDMANMVTYLASAGGDYISGAVLTIDGGRDNWMGRWPAPGMLGASAAGAALTEQAKSK